MLESKIGFCIAENKTIFITKKFIKNVTINIRTSAILIDDVIVYQIRENKSPTLSDIKKLRYMCNRLIESIKYDLSYDIDIDELEKQYKEGENN